jgi:hypothetical protein
VTRYRETENGELVLEELELELKIKSSQISQFHSAMTKVNSTPKESSNAVRKEEKTCW